MDCVTLVTSSLLSLWLLLFDFLRRRRQLGLGRFFEAQHFGGLGSEAKQFVALWVILVHPSHTFVEPLARLFLFAQLPVGHGQKEKEFRTSLWVQPKSIAHCLSSRLPV